MITRGGVLAKPRAVKLSCGHVQKDEDHSVGDQVGCLQCPQRRAYRSHINEHTYSQLRKVVKVGRLKP